MSYSSLEDLLTPSASADDNSQGVRRLLFAYDASDGARNAIRVARGVFNDGEALILCVAKANPRAIAPVAGPGLRPAPAAPVTASYRHATARAIAVQGVEVAAAAGWRAQPLTAVATPGKGVAHAIDLSERASAAARSRCAARSQTITSISAAASRAAPERPKVMSRPACSRSQDVEGKRRPGR